MNRERRFSTIANCPIKLRGEGDEPKTLHGYAAVFYNADDPGTEYQIWDDIVERIMPGAFDGVLSNNPADCVCLFDHRSETLLGRQSSQTLILSVDERGLFYESPSNPDDSDWNNVIAKAERGDLQGSSFAFIPGKQVWIEDDDLTIREIHEVQALYDVGPVTYPAYKSTSAGSRQLALTRAADVEQARKDLEAHRAERQREIDRVKFRIDSMKFKQSR